MEKGGGRRGGPQRGAVCVHVHVCVCIEYECEEQIARFYRENEGADGGLGKPWGLLKRSLPLRREKRNEGDRAARCSSRLKGP